MEETVEKMKGRLADEARKVREALQALSHWLRVAFDRKLLPRMLYLRAWLLSEFRSLNPDDDGTSDTFYFDANEFDALASSLALLDGDVRRFFADNGTDFAHDILAMSNRAMQAFEAMLASWYEAFLAH